MVFFTRKVHRKLGGNFTVLILTDREDQDRQIYKTFAGCGLVDSEDAFMEHLEKKRAILLEYPKAVPTGKNMRVKHPDGLVAEYVEHK